MTHSISKTFLSSVACLAVDEVLIRNVDDRVATYVPTDHFQGAHNSQITWDHFLRQTSFWRGTLWGSLIGQTAPVKSLGLSSHVRRQHLAPNGNTMMFE